jgi:hypothetical protein
VKSRATGKTEKQVLPATVANEINKLQRGGGYTHISKKFKSTNEE